MANAICGIVVVFAAIWGLDEHGCFLSGSEDTSGVIGRVSLWLEDPYAMCRSDNALVAAQTGVAQRVLLDLKSVHISLLTESRSEEAHPRSDKEKVKRLLFLFQRDLLPGVSGKILESKGQRDNIAVQTVSWEAKAACWAFIGLLDVGMLFYILLFALSQTVHRQGAWALSFAMWLVVEVLFVSSSTVLFTHVLVPSLIMRDVNKIKLKLAESIRAFNKSVRTRRRNKTADDAADDPASFNAANYLFVSTRLAQQWSELREAQIIAQFRTPWPKQSYQREVDVSKEYSKKFSALSRSASVIAVFFLTNLLQVPPALQDMVVQMCSTAVVGYTTLLHIDLYRFYAPLVILPTLVAAVAVHFIVRSNSSSARLRLQRLFGLDKSDPTEDGEVVVADADEASPEPGQDLECGSRDSADDNCARKVQQAETAQDRRPTVLEGSSDSSGEEQSCEEGEVEAQDRYGELHQPLPLSAAAVRGHMTRDQSTHHGLNVLGKLQKDTACVEAKDDSVDELVSVYTPSHAAAAVRALSPPTLCRSVSLASSSQSCSSFSPPEKVVLAGTHLNAAEDVITEDKNSEVDSAEEESDNGSSSDESEREGSQEGSQHSGVDSDTDCSESGVTVVAREEGNKQTSSPHIPGEPGERAPHIAARQDQSQCESDGTFDTPSFSSDGEEFV
jgi:hypothetical protein